MHWLEGVFYLVLGWHSCRLLFKKKMDFDLFIYLLVINQYGDGGDDNNNNIVVDSELANNIAFYNKIAAQIEAMKHDDNAKLEVAGEGKMVVGIGENPHWSIR